MTNNNSFRAGAQLKPLQNHSNRRGVNLQQPRQNHSRQVRQNPNSVVNNPGMTVAAAREIRIQLAQGLAALKYTTRDANPAVDWHAMSPRSSFSSEGGVPIEVEDLLDDLIHENQEKRALQSPIQAEDTDMVQAPTVQATDATGTYIDPYGPDPNASFNVLEEDMDFAYRVLANTGVNSLIDYPLSTSPRMNKGEITRIMNGHSARYGTDRINTSMEVGQELWFPTFTMVNPNLFTTFSYDAPFQPRTAAAKADESLPVSPSANRMFHSPCPSVASDGGVAIEVNNLVQKTEGKDNLQSDAQDDDTDMADSPTAESVAGERSYIDPYSPGLDATFYVPADNSDLAIALLAHSGVNAFTEYPTSTSPRMTDGQVWAALKEFSGVYHPEDLGLNKEVGCEMVPRGRRAIRLGCFTGFSYTSSCQPRTEAARAEEGMPVSPRTIPTTEQMNRAERVAAGVEAESEQDDSMQIDSE